MDAVCEQHQLLNFLSDTVEHLHLIDKNMILPLWPYMVRFPSAPFAGAPRIPYKLQLSVDPLLSCL